MESQEQTAADIRALTTQVGKIGLETRELIRQVNELTETIENGIGSSSQELLDAVAALRAQVVAVDELVADIPAPTTPEDPDAPNSTTGGQG